MKQRTHFLFVHGIAYKHSNELIAPIFRFGCKKGLLHFAADPFKIILLHPVRISLNSSQYRPRRPEYTWADRGNC